MSDLSAETLAWLNAEAGNDRYIAHLAAHAAECVRFVAAIDRGEVRLAESSFLYENGSEQPSGLEIGVYVRRKPSRCGHPEHHISPSVAPDALTAYRRATAPTLPEDRV